MRKYDAGDEMAIRSERLVREWTRSGLLDKAQHDRMAQGLKVGLRRTNPFLRIILFAFGILIIAASILLVGETLGTHNDAAVGLLCFFSGVVCLMVAELFIDQLSLYRFGIEEAAAVAGIALLAAAGGFFTSSMHTSRPGEFPALVGLTVGSIAAFAVYLRFGYIYAAIASLACLSAVPFQTPLSDPVQRLFSAGLLTCVFLVVRSKRREGGEEFPGDEYSTIQAGAWAGAYAFLNLRLLSVGLLFSPQPLSSLVLPALFYWFTYAAIWLVPGIGLLLAVRDKDRPLLDTNVVLALLTLITNKPYLGLARQTWDPIVFGLFLITAPLFLRRWLSTGERNGFTAARLLSSDKRRLSMLGTASAAFGTAHQGPASPSSTDTVQPGGGRSGGAGASGSF